MLPSDPMPLQSTKSVFKKLTGSLFGKENGGDDVSSHSCGNATDVSTGDDGSASTRDMQQVSGLPHLQQLGAVVPCNTALGQCFC